MAKGAAAKQAAGTKATKASAPKPEAHAKPGSERSFLFRGCSLRAAGTALTVTSAGALSVRLGAASAAGVVRWTTPTAVTGPVVIECGPGAPSLFDRRAARKRPVASGGLSITFRGAVRYSRLLLDDGPALLVQGSAVRLTGLPGGARPFDTASFFPPVETDAVHGGSGRDGGVDPSGPHQPFP
jgi:hypothetical protein